MRATFFVLCAIMAVAMSLPTDSKPAIKPAEDLAPHNVEKRSVEEAVKAEDNLIEDVAEEEDEDEDDEAVEDEEDEDEDDDDEEDEDEDDEEDEDDDDEEDEDDDDEEDEEETPAEELPVITL